MAKPVTRKRIKNHSRSTTRRARPRIEEFERRQLLAANLFLQGTAFVDNNGDGTLDKTENYLPSATIQLFSGSTQIGQATTDSNGQYYFDDTHNLFTAKSLVPGTAYTLVEIPPSGYANTKVSAASQLNNPVTITQPNTIQVTLADPTNVYANWLGYGLEYDVSYTLNSLVDNTGAGQYKLSLGTKQAPPNTNLSAAFNSNCVDLSNFLTKVSGGETFQVIPNPSSALLNNGGRAAYLYNHYRDNPSIPGVDPRIQAAALQVALWELVYDADSNPASVATFLTSGNYKNLTPIGNSNLATITAIATQATAFLAESAGKSETAIYLNATAANNPDSKTGGSQGMLATEAFNFGNRRLASPAIATLASAGGVIGTSVFDTALVTGGQSPTGTVTFRLYDVTDPDCTGTPIYVDANEPMTAGIATSQSYATAAVGTYHWIATYNGDTNNSPISGGAADEPVTTIKASPTIVTTASAGGAGGLLLTDSATLSGGYKVGSGSITFKLIAPDSSTTTETVTINGDGIYNATGVLATQLGTYTWSATYNGDAFNKVAVDNGVGESLTIVGASLSGLVYSDGDNNGVYTIGESPIDSVPIALVNSHGVTIATTSTANGGQYAFNSLFPDTYSIVELTQPSGYLNGTNNPGSLGGTASNDATPGSLSAITVTQGQNGQNYNFGEITPGSLSGFVYADANNDGHKVGEAGIGGVTLTLTGTSDLGPIGPQTATTAPDGSYSFTGLRPGSYTVTEGSVSGYLDGLDALVDVVIAGSVGTDLVSGIGVAQGANTPNNNFGEILAGSLSGFVYADANNDGHKVGEAGIGGTTLTLTGTSDLGPISPQTATTAPDGSYSFTGLRPGSYTVTEGTVSGYLDGLDALVDVVIAGSATTDLISSIAVAQAANTPDNNFGEVAPGSISGFVYYDSNNNGKQSDDTTHGIGGVPMALGGTDDLGATVTGTTTTAPDGSYSFGNLRPGTYTVTEGTITGFLDGLDALVDVVIAGSVGTDLVSGIGVAQAANTPNNNFGEILAGSLSGFVYADANNDGHKVGEAGIGGITLTLSGSNDLGPITSQVTTTAPDGSYSFTGLRPGSYTVTEGTVSGYLDGQDALGDVVIAGSASTDLVAGIVVLQNADSANNNFGEILAGSLSGFVYADANNDGHKVGESGIGGTTLTLTGTSDLGPIAAQTATTGPDGSYSFGNLRPGTYIVTEGSVTGYLDGQDALVDIVIAGSATTDVVAGIGVVQNANTPNNNFGEVKAGSLSGFVYADANNDGHKVGEAGIGGITLTLSGSNDLGPITSQVTTTAPDGSYSFGNLRPGSYNVTEGTVAGYLDGLDAKNDVVIAGSATTDLVAGIAVVQNANSANNNFGEVKAGSLSGFVYADANNDGHKVGESGIGGITLTLSGTSDLGTIAAQTATTAADGSYSFTGLRPGSYTVTEGAVSGYLDGLDAKNDVVIAGSTTTDLVAGIAVVQNADSANNNFGEVKAGSLSGFVYVDADNDGVKDSGEVGINAVKVTLSGTNDQGKVSIDATTDGSGYYNFGNLRPGTYTITETQPANYADGMDKIGTPGGTSGNDVFSSINLNAGVNGANNNFGELPPITISGTTFLDTTGNGLSSDDLALGKANNNPVVVNLYLDKNNNGVIDTGDTLAGTQNVDVSTGAFSFTKLAPGTYIVQEVVPAGYILTGPTNAPNTYVVQAVLGQSYPNKDFDNFQVDTCAANSVYYVINGAAGCRTVTNLRGNVDQGDTVTAYFKIGGSSADTVSLVSYIAPGATFDANVASQQSIFQVVTGTFNPSTSTSGYYSLTVKVPTSFFQVDFVCGEAIDHFGPAGGNVFYSAQGRLISADNDGTVAAGILSGYVYEDLNGSGTRQSNDLGIANVTITLYDSKGVLVATQLTGSDGSYRFTGLTGDTYKLVETQPGAYLDGKEAVGTAGGNASVNDVISAIPITLKAPGFANGFEYNFAEVKAAVISGFAYVDSNDNGSKDSGETGLGNVAITLSGKNDLGQAITPVTINTNSSGAYSFTGLRPGTYVVTEAQPTGYATTGNSIGTSGGSLASPTTDVITAINLGSNANAVNYNFGELAVGTALTRSQTATIGFWHNNNGQALINSFNGGPNATGLGNWLASSFGNVYASLAGQKNSQIASYFLTLFNQSGQKTAAQFLAGALAVYATTPSLAGGSMATSYGFIVSTAGTGAATYNVGTQLVPYGGPRGVVSIIQLIQFINGKSSGGSLASGNSSLLNVINTIFSGINQTGDIV